VKSTNGRPSEPVAFRYRDQRLVLTEASDDVDDSSEREREWAELRARARRALGETIPIEAKEES
jgi:hypothetical protein